MGGPHFFVQLPYTIGLISAKIWYYILEIFYTVERWINSFTPHSESDKFHISSLVNVKHLNVGLFCYMLKFSNIKDAQFYENKYWVQAEYFLPQTREMKKLIIFLSILVWKVGTGSTNKQTWNRNNAFELSTYFNCAIVFFTKKEKKKRDFPIMYRYKFLGG